MFKDQDKIDRAFDTMADSLVGLTTGEGVAVLTMLVGALTKQIPEDRMDEWKALVQEAMAIALRVGSSPTPPTTLN